jgi:hypothetical protein
VGEVAIAGDARDRAHRDDHAGRFRRGHRPARLAEAEEHAPEVHADDAIPFRGRHVQDRRPAAHAGGEDRDRWRPELIHDGGDRVLHLVLVRDVARQVLLTAALIRIDVEHGDPRATSLQPFCRRRADAAGAAGDDRDRSPEFHAEECI